MKTNAKSVRLQPGETVLLSRRPNSAPIMVFGTLVFIFISMVISSYSYMYFELTAETLSLVIFGTFAFTLLHFWLLSIRTRYILTDERIFIRYGGLRPSVVSLEREEVSRIDIEESRIESVLGSGRISIKSSKGKEISVSSLSYSKELGLELTKHLPNADIDKEIKTKTQLSGTSWNSIDVLEN
jgi:uncharacterized membrane protein YdbT with pleckstrin-like domain